jgi:hypothetical protein
MNNDDSKDEYGIVGLSVADAQKILEEKKISNRVWKTPKDNECVQCDHDPERINLEVKKGKVVSYSYG